MWFGSRWRFAEIELRDQVAELGAEMLPDSLELADELSGSSSEIWELLRAENKERDDSYDQPMQRRERTIERHAPSLRSF